MRLLVAWEVEVSPSGLSKVSAVNISKVLGETFFEGVFSFTNILVIALFAMNQIHKVLCLAVIFLV